MPVTNASISSTIASASPAQKLVVVPGQGDQASSQKVTGEIRARCRSKSGRRRDRVGTEPNQYHRRTDEKRTEQDTDGRVTADCEREPTGGGAD